MKSGRLRRNNFINDFLFFSASIIITISFLISFLSMKNDCLFMQNEIYHLDQIRINHENRVKILSGKIKNVSRQDLVEKVAYEKFKMFVPNPESLIVYIEN